MLYFIPWVVFLLFMILLVPITMMMEKRKNPVVAGAYDDSQDQAVNDGVDDFAGDGEVESLGDADDGFGGGDDAFGGDGFGGGGDDAFGGEDFSAFDDI